ncbi:hypothetical protein B0J13DRAFT_255047 [Dactylonectria estremocensis]|uniref:Uncharacterized protein n=1 Tax=Dactylonectria estremocensis TaxID=1079267 RepID=A0A9P9F3D8_9HYPO|nr:hypothetical protein B0J13DRAFT_255047 [Dactylonectria estremocensis]
MGATISVIKTLIVPAVISLIIFVLLTYVVIPAWRHYRNRYSQYLPLDSLSSQTSSLRQRITSRLASIPFPARWRQQGNLVFVGDLSEDGLDDDDGEELGDVDDETWRAIERDTQTRQPDNSRRLSRDLEEGFRDDSDDEPDRPMQITNVRV